MAKAIIWRLPLVTVGYFDQTHISVIGVLPRAIRLQPLQEMEMAVSQPNLAKEMAMPFLAPKMAPHGGQNFGLEANIWLWQGGTQNGSPLDSAIQKNDNNFRLYTDYTEYFKEQCR